MKGKGVEKSRPWPKHAPEGDPVPRRTHSLAGWRSRASESAPVETSTCPLKKHALHPAGGHPRLGGAWN